MDLPERTVRKVTKETKVIPVQKVLRVRKVIREIRVTKETLVRKDLLEVEEVAVLDLRVNKAPPDQKVHKAFRVRRVDRGLKDRKDLKDYRARKVMTVQAPILQMWSQSSTFTRRHSHEHPELRRSLLL